MAGIAYLQITRKCNQNCIFCSNPDNNEVRSMEDAKNTILKFRDLNYDGVILTGGEPTVYDGLPELIAHCRQNGIPSRIISNGQNLADKGYLNTLARAGLDHIHLSLHSFKDDVQSELTGNPGSLENLTNALENCGRTGISININTVINSYNAGHLHLTVKWLIHNFPFIRHFVWNNLDPFMNRVEQNRHVIAQLQDFEVSLFKAALFLKRNNRTFRIERVPLCYMAEFAEFSTETRKIIKNEKRAISFLDNRGDYSQDNFFYEKGPPCQVCELNPVCAGLYGGDAYFPFDDLFPVFMNRKRIMDAILNPKPIREAI
ncbi:radical SAM protein [Desulfobacter sp.]|uniref:radical SAM protein n=1 Tax=Desulfobacter sp. TaxID=2294 RepID=UPI003D132514